ncbi:MAG: serine/threonine-protein phosphatase [Proteobacteria bacterium]|jgi:PPM family protein phosphatase|nr:serine/threonine-protein phosphatase [Pseudomonadota bacterium]
MEIEAYAHTDVGPVREQNEDAFLVDIENGIFILADGMGGHAAGEVASLMAVHTIHTVLVGERDPEETRLVRDFDSTDTSDILRERLRYAMNQASIAIRREMQLRPETAGMGTTVVVLLVEGNQAHLAHAGDSRAYLYRFGRLTRLTRDHTVVQQEIDAGRLTPELARLLPTKHILTQSVGFHGPVEPDTATRVLEPGDIFILCSDGLTDPMTDETMSRLIGTVPLDMLAQALVEEALKAGTEDNTSVVVVGVDT